MDIPGVSDEYLAQVLYDISVMSSALTLKLDYLSLAAVEDIEDIRMALAYIVRDIVAIEDREAEVQKLEQLFSMESE